MYLFRVDRDSKCHSSGRRYFETRFRPGGPTLDGALGAAGRSSSRRVAYLTVYLAVTAGSIAAWSPARARRVDRSVDGRGRRSCGRISWPSTRACAFTRDCLENTRTTLTWATREAVRVEHAVPRRAPRLSRNSVPRAPPPPTRGCAGKIENLEPGYVRASVKVGALSPGRMSAMKITAIDTFTLRIPTAKPIALDPARAPARRHTDPHRRRARRSRLRAGVRRRRPPRRWTRTRGGWPRLLVGEDPTQVGRLWEKMYRADRGNQKGRRSRANALLRASTSGSGTWRARPRACRWPCCGAPSTDRVGRVRQPAAGAPTRWTTSSARRSVTRRWAAAITR